jgi:hypothetical protein
MKPRRVRQRPWRTESPVSYRLIGDTFLGTFTIRPGRCFRMIRDPNPRRQAQARHCRQPVAFDGRFRRLGCGPSWPDTGLVFTREDGNAIHPERASKWFDYARMPLSSRP